MTTSLGIAFWNTRLAPSRPSKGWEGPSVAAAAAMIDEVIQTGVHFFGLSEVDEDVMQILRKRVPRLNSWRFEIADASTNSESWNLGFFSDPEVVVQSQSVKVEAQRGSRTLRAGLAVEVAVAGQHEPIHIYLSHWTGIWGDPDTQSACRRECAKRLHAEIDQAKRIVMIGDFNDEPHSPMIDGHLATRDPGRAEPYGLMFNPSWLLLSGDCSDVEGAFGTARYKGDATRWKTIDQIMVSPNLLRRDGGLVLTSVRRFDAIYKKHNPASPKRAQFDHLPISVQFRAQFAGEP